MLVQGMKSGLGRLKPCFWVTNRTGRKFNRLKLGVARLFCPMLLFPFGNPVSYAGRRGRCAEVQQGALWNETLVRRPLVFSLWPSFASPQECSIRVPHRSVPHQCHKSVQRKALSLQSRVGQHRSQAHVALASRVSVDRRCSLWHSSVTLARDPQSMSLTRKAWRL